MLDQTKHRQPRWRHWILTRLGTIALEFACYALIFIIVFVYIYRAFS
jgi:hypothetical protein